MPRKTNKSNVVAYPGKKAPRPAEKTTESGVPRQDDPRVMALDLPPGTLSPEELRARIDALPL